MCYKISRLQLFFKKKKKKKLKKKGIKALYDYLMSQILPVELILTIINYQQNTHLIYNDFKSKFQ